MFSGRKYSKLDNDVVLQVDEIVDISLKKSKRNKFKYSENPTFKFVLDDSGFKMIGLMRSAIPGFADGSEGKKIKISAGTEIFYGIFFLNKDNTKILGGYSQIQMNIKKDLLNSFPNEDQEFQNTLSKCDIAFEVNDQIRYNFDDEDIAIQQSNEQESYMIEQVYEIKDLQSLGKQKLQKVKVNANVFGIDYLELPSENKKVLLIVVKLVSLTSQDNLDVIVDRKVLEKYLTVPYEDWLTYPNTIQQEFIPKLEQNLSQIQPPLTLIDINQDDSGCCFLLIDE